MKKNLITVMVLALVLVNLVLTALLTITIVPQTKKANELITQVSVPLIWNCRAALLHRMPALFLLINLPPTASLTA